MDDPLLCYHDSCYREQNPPSPAEWEVINRYSNRIRELRIPDKLSMSFLQFISFQQLSLPNLKLLIWDSHSTRLDIVYVRSLLSSNLLALDVRMEMGKSRALLSFFLNYHLLCPNMKLVKLDLSKAHYGAQIDLDLFILAISKAIVNHKKLECLEIFAYVRKGFWEVLFMSLALEVTSLAGRGYTNIFPFTEVSIPPTDTPLQNVRDLRLTIHDLSLFTRLLRPHDQPFCTICLEVQVPLSHTTTEELFAALATHQRQGSLESITIDNSHRDVQKVDHHHPVSFDALRPLVRLGRLRELKIILHHGISLDDAQLGIMAVSWPLLEVLKLDPINPRLPMTKYPTLTGLMTLLTSCPKLRRLQLPLDARQVPENGLSEPWNTSIKSLDLCGLPISRGDAGRVSRFLRARLPSDMCLFVTSDNSDHGDLWKQVDANIRG